MTERELGNSGLKVSAIGLGCMGMSEFYDPKQMDDAESIRVIHRYLDQGGNFLDTADTYGIGRNEVLVGKAIRPMITQPDEPASRMVAIGRGTLEKRNETAELGRDR